MLGEEMHAVVPGSAPTCAHVMPRHGYALSNATLTAAKSGKVPASYSPNLRCSLIVLAATGLQWCTSGSTAAEKVAPSAAFFWLRSAGTSPTLYLRGHEGRRWQVFWRRWSVPRGGGEARAHGRANA